MLGCLQPLRLFVIKRPLEIHIILVVLLPNPADPPLRIPLAHDEAFEIFLSKLPTEERRCIAKAKPGWYPCRFPS